MSPRTSRGLWIALGAIVFGAGLATLGARYLGGNSSNSAAPLGAQAPSLPRGTGPLPQPASTATTAVNNSSPTEPMVLVGTFASTDPTRGSAIIGPDERSATLQRTHSEIAPGAWLREVYGNHVVIERGGVREVLKIASAHANGGNVTRSEAMPAASLPPSGITDDVRFGPSAPTDELQGIRVFPGRNRGAFARLGFHPGDLITEINGVPTSGQPGPDINALLRNGSDSIVTVFRAGRLQQISVHGGYGTNDAPDTH